MNYKLKDLAIGYGKLVIASGINATLKAGELTCLLGPNGAGKSTLLRTLCAFQQPISGEVLLCDNDRLGIDKEKETHRCNFSDQNQEKVRNIHEVEARELAKMLGVVLTDRISVQGMTVRDLVAMGRSPYTNYWGTLTEEDDRIIDDAIKECRIETLAYRDSTTLSDGERQKVMIAKALAQQTPIILLDEPTAFLDFPSKVETMLLLSRLAHEGGKAILISTHDLDLALQTADRLWLMQKNSCIQEFQTGNPNTSFITGTPKELASDGSLAHCFSTPNVSFSPEQLRFTIK